MNEPENIVAPDDNFIMVDRDDYHRILKDSQLLDALMQMGVDNWEGYEEAINLLTSDEY